MLLLLGLIGGVLLLAIAGTVALLAALMREHELARDMRPPLRVPILSRVRERILLRWDTTRRLR